MISSPAQLLIHFLRLIVVVVAAVVVIVVVIQNQQNTKDQIRERGRRQRCYNLCYKLNFFEIQ